MTQWVLVCDSDVQPSFSSGAGGNIIKCSSGLDHVGGVPSVIEYKPQVVYQQVPDSGPFDYAYASALWAFAFTMVVGLYVVSRYAGVVLDFIRRG